MDSCKPASCYLRSTSAVSLNERFSQVLMDQLTQSRMMTSDPVLPQQGRACGLTPVVLLLKRQLPSPLNLQTLGPSERKQRLWRRRRSVWTRLGWQQVTRRPRGFWSFRNKYRWRARFTSTYRRRGNLRSRLGQRRLLPKGTAQEVTAERAQLRLHLPKDVPTKKQLDAQLDEYMSLSKSRLDEQLDDYMSMSKSRLDAQLDEYMSMVGQTHWG